MVALREGAWTGVSDHTPVMYENSEWAAERDKRRQRRKSKTDLICKYTKEKAPSRCAALLTCWWRTVARLRMFPSDWCMWTIVLLYKRGEQSRRENYRPLCLLSYTRKITDTAVLAQIKKLFTHIKAPFGF